MLPETAEMTQTGREGEQEQPNGSSATWAGLGCLVHAAHSSASVGDPTGSVRTPVSGFTKPLSQRVISP